MKLFGRLIGLPHADQASRLPPSDQPFASVSATIRGEALGMASRLDGWGLLGKKVMPPLSVDQGLNSIMVPSI
jgi:hypothetical protein